ncbi:acetyltransferase [Carbonactinospora thermoautotrophica]|uniref:ASCH domain-containing protein n=1 Tax=Carbonactinospora thermoautotrophica TaxID=1469144 RepID=UPI0022705682|nr:ASCH domain-containing protein [Carbonactinospora thermoautotrophica]MCX9190443.1 acetyltransferase [Carbonactinospora thermoautotrophica]
MGETEPVTRDMWLYKEYFDLIASGRKTVEVRVGYPNMRRIRPGWLIRFRTGDEHCLTRVRRVGEYGSFEEMLDPRAIGATEDRAELLAAIRRIYPPEKEALGVLAIEVERV